MRIRWLKAPPVAEDDPPAKLSTRASKVAPARKTAAAASTRKAQRAAADGVFARHTATSRGPAPKPNSPFPDPLFDATDDPANFPGALIYLMGRFGDSYWQLCRAVGCELRHPAADRAALSIHRGAPAISPRRFTDMNRRPAKAQTATYGQYCTILSLVSRTDQWSWSSLLPSVTPMQTQLPC